MSSSSKDNQTSLSSSRTRSGRQFHPLNFANISMACDIHGASPPVSNISTVAPASPSPYGVLGAIPPVSSAHSFAPLIGSIFDSHSLSVTGTDSHGFCRVENAYVASNMNMSTIPYGENREPMSHTSSYRNTLSSTYPLTTHLETPVQHTRKYTKPRMLCYGDSETYGSVPGEYSTQTLEMQREHVPEEFTTSTLEPPAATSSPLVDQHTPSIEQVKSACNDEHRSKMYSQYSDRQEIEMLKGQVRKLEYYISKCKQNLNDSSSSKQPNPIVNESLFNNSGIECGGCMQNASQELGRLCKQDPSDAVVDPDSKFNYDSHVQNSQLQPQISSARFRETPSSASNTCHEPYPSSRISNVDKVIHPLLNDLNTYNSQASKMSENCTQRNVQFTNTDHWVHDRTFGRPNRNNAPFISGLPHLTAVGQEEIHVHNPYKINVNVHNKSRMHSEIVAESNFQSLGRSSNNLNAETQDPSVIKHPLCESKRHPTGLDNYTLTHSLDNSFDSCLQAMKGINPVSVRSQPCDQDVERNSHFSSNMHPISSFSGGPTDSHAYFSPHVDSMYPPRPADKFSTFMPLQNELSFSGYDSMRPEAAATTERHILATNYVPFNSGKTAYGSDGFPRALSRKFTGDPLEYESWRIRISQEIVENGWKPNIACEYILSQTGGAVRDVVLQIASIEFNSSWDLVKEILRDIKTQFAQDHMVRRAIEKEIAKHPVVTEDLDSLNSFIRLVRKIDLHKGVCGDLMGFDMAEGTAALRAKLPRIVQDDYGRKWRMYENRFKTPPPLSFLIEVIKQFRSKALSSRYAPVLPDKDRRIQLVESYEKNSAANVANNTPVSGHKTPILESYEKGNAQQSKFQNPATPSHLTENQSIDSYCSWHNSSGHFISNCKAFLKLSVFERREFVMNKGLCLNCLKTNHRAAHCPSDVLCQQCGRRHHILLHHQKAISKDHEARVGCTTVCGDRSLAAFCTKVLLVDLALASNPAWRFNQNLRHN